MLPSTNICRGQNVGLATPKRYRKVKVSLKREMYTNQWKWCYVFLDFFNLEITANSLDCLIGHTSSSEWLLSIFPMPFLPQVFPQNGLDVSFLSPWARAALWSYNAGCPIFDAHDVFFPWFFADSRFHPYLSRDAPNYCKWTNSFSIFLIFSTQFDRDDPTEFLSFEGSTAIILW